MLLELCLPCFNLDQNCNERNVLFLFTGSQSVESSLKYIKEQFRQSKPVNKQMYIHACCALDVPSFKDLLTTVLECIAEMNIKKSKNY